MSNIQPDTHLILNEAIRDTHNSLRGRAREIFDSSITGTPIDNPPHPTSIRNYESVCRDALRKAIGRDTWIHRRKYFLRPKRQKLPTKNATENTQVYSSKYTNAIKHVLSIVPECTNGDVQVRDWFLFRKTVSEIVSDGFKKIGTGLYSKKETSGTTIIKTCRHLQCDDKFCIVTFKDLKDKDVLSVLT